MPTSANPSQDYEQLSFKPEFFAVKGQVLDDDEPLPAKPKTKSRPTRGKSPGRQPTAAQLSPGKSQFRFPAIQNEEIFESKLQEAPSAVNTKKYKNPEIQGETYSYSTINFGSDGTSSDSYVGKSKAKPPKRSTSSNPGQLYNLDQNFGPQQTKFDKEIDGSNVEISYGGFKPTTKFNGHLKAVKQPKPTLFKSTEDDFKDSEFFDFSIRPRPGAQSSSVIPSGPGGKYDKFKSELGVKSLAIKGNKNKFDPQLHSGFKPSFKLRDYPQFHGADLGSGVASTGQIKTYYDAAESDRDERIKQKLSSDPHPASKAQYAQFLRAKEDERLEKLVEEQFKLQQQKQFAQEKEAELKHQQQALHRQKEKLKQVEQQLNTKVTRQVQSVRQKRRPVTTNPSLPSRRQRNPSPLNFSVSNNGQTLPLRTLKSKDGTYRVSFNVQH